jgi:5-oxoprolinase (ATP-hydrolysing) subunit A
VDLNADVGESYGVWTLGDDDAVLAVVSSANVACGFHAGDPLTLRRTVRAAQARGVTIGAQVSYPDLVGFGRRDLELTHDELVADVLYQVGALRGLGADVRYVKPHGALYNRAARDPEVAVAIAEAAGDLPVLLLAGSPGRRAIGARGECFADRAYTPDGRLVSRREAGAVLTDPAEVAARAVRMAVEREVVTTDGSVLGVDAVSICLHGDTPGAAALARAVRDALQQACVRIAPFE